LIGACTSSYHARFRKPGPVRDSLFVHLLRVAAKQQVPVLFANFIIMARMAAMVLESQVLPLWQQGGLKNTFMEFRAPFDENEASKNSCFIHGGDRIKVVRRSKSTPSLDNSCGDFLKVMTVYSSRARECKRSPSSSTTCSESEVTSASMTLPLSSKMPHTALPQAKMDQQIELHVQQVIDAMTSGCFLSVEGCSIEPPSTIAAAYTGVNFRVRNLPANHQARKRWLPGLLRSVSAVLAEELGSASLEVSGCSIYVDFGGSKCVSISLSEV